MKLTDIVMYVLLLVCVLAVSGRRILRSTYSSGQTKMTQTAQLITADVEMDMTHLSLEGSSKGKVVLIEFSDYDCQFCARYAIETAPILKSEFVKTGRVLYGFANFPTHQNSRMLATAAMCAADQQRFWQMHDAIFRTTPTALAEVLSIARDLGLVISTFSECIATDAHAAQIYQQIKLSEQIGLTGTPSIVLGTVVAKNRIKPMKLIVGAKPETVFRTAINDFLYQVEQGSQALSLRP